MYAAGAMSSLLGIGSGVLKVPAMDSALRLPIKVSSATSNFMIGVTAAASAGIYYARGDILADVAAPVALGSIFGAYLGEDPHADVECTHPHTLRRRVAGSGGQDVHGRISGEEPGRGDLTMGVATDDRRRLLRMELILTMLLRYGAIVASGWIVFGMAMGMFGGFLHSSGSRTDVWLSGSCCSSPCRY